jgi:superoxide reductase
MIARDQVYKCDSCGNIAQILHPGTCVPDCCGKPTRLLAENSVDAAKEKHLPVVEKTAEGFKVTVGSVAHPMEADHYIEWIELLAVEGGKPVSYRKYLVPGDKPEASFAVKAAAATAREYCNKHGLWKASI